MAAISVPNLFHTNQRAKVRETISYMATVETAIEDYRIDLYFHKFPIKLDE